METKTTTHTPGPWKFDPFDRYYIVADTHPEKYIALVEFADGSLTGDEKSEAVAEGRYPKDDDEARANARLIAASPELLDEVKAMHSTYCSDCSGDCPTLALIAKASGTAPDDDYDERDQCPMCGVRSNIPCRCQEWKCGWCGRDCRNHMGQASRRCRDAYNADV